MEADESDDVGNKISQSMMGHNPKPASRCVTLTTDFGEADWFVAAMKGVILRINPEATIVDVTHLVKPADLSGAAFILQQFVGLFPVGTVHVAVVDPGVGGHRKPLAVRWEDSFLIGPDNGLFTAFTHCNPHVRIRELANPSILADNPSATFHGRDIFAPAAAHLSKGFDFERVGPEIPSTHLVRLPDPPEDQGVFKVVYIDHFGNAITNIPLAAYPNPAAIRVGERIDGPIVPRPCYSQIPTGEAALIPGSSGFWEIAVDRGNAARQLSLHVGSILHLTIK